MSLVILGTVAFDAIETPFGKTDKILGGAATYISLAASNFIPETKILSVIGDDFPEEYLTMLQSKGANIEGLRRIAGEKTFFWSGVYHNDMNTRDTLDTQLNVLLKFNSSLPESYKDADFVMLGNLDPSIQLAALEQFNQRPKLVVLDTMNFWMDIALEPLVKVISKVDVLTINDEEARQLSGEYSLVKAARKILAMGPKFLIIKKGEHGALLFSEDEIFYVPALPLEEVFDPTGAGDSFAGGFTGYLCKTRDISFENMKRAVLFGSAAASFCVEKFGTERLESITPEDFSNRVQEFVDLSQVEIDW